MTDSVSRTDQNGWTLLTLNRPAKLNALTVETFRELRRHVIDLRADDGVRCVVVRGAGKCFSAGHDLTAIAEGEDPPSPGWAALAEAGRAAPRDLAILKAQVGRLGRGVGEAAVQTHGASA